MLSPHHCLTSWYKQQDKSEHNLGSNAELGSVELSLSIAQASKTNHNFHYWDMKTVGSNKMQGDERAPEEGLKAWPSTNINLCHSSQVVEIQPAASDLS